MKALRNLYDTPYKRLTEGDVKFIPIGIPGAEKLMNDLPTKKITVITGVPKEGKSTVVHRIGLNAVDKGFRVLLVDGEHDQETLINTLYGMVIGGTPNAYEKLPYNKIELLEPKQHVVDMLREWHKDRLLIYSKYLDPIDNLELLFDFIEKVVVDNKIDLVILDNIMVLVNGKQVEKNENQGRFMKRTSDLAKFKNCHCIVVAHPSKLAKQGEDMEIYDVSGNSEIINLLDYLVQIRRDFTNDNADGYFRIMLNRTVGANIGNIPLKFVPYRGLFQMDLSGKAITYEFNWQNEGKQEKFVTTNDSPF
jgi:twinkle protein